MQYSASAFLLLQVDQMAIPVVQRGGVRWIRAGRTNITRVKIRSFDVIKTSLSKFMEQHGVPGPERVMDKQGPGFPPGCMARVAHLTALAVRYGWLGNVPLLGRPEAGCTFSPGIICQRLSKKS